MPPDTPFGLSMTSGLQDPTKSLARGWTVQLRTYRLVSKLFLEEGHKRPRGGGSPLLTYGWRTPKNKGPASGISRPYSGCQYSGLTTSARMTISPGVYCISATCFTP